jgi:adenylate cyclase
MSNVPRRYDVVIAVFLFLAAIPAQWFELFAPLEDKVNSIRHQLRMDYRASRGQLAPDDIFIVNTDEKFFTQYKSFPLRRTDIGKIAQNLTALGAKVVAVDLLMDFPSSYNEDPALAESLKTAGNTLLVNQGVVVDHKIVSLNHPTEVLDKASRSAYTNIESSNRWVSSMSRLTIYPEAIPMVGGWPFSVTAAAMYLGVEPKFEPGTLHLGDLSVPLDRGNNIYIDFPPLVKGSKFLSQDHGMSAIEFLDLSGKDERDLEELSLFVKDKLVLLGDTSDVSHDWFDTPAGSVYGVEIIADTIASILAGGPLKVSSLWVQMIAPLVGLVLTLVVAIRIKQPPLRGSLIMGFLALFVVIVGELYIRQGFIVPLSYVVVATLLSYLSIEFRQYQIERDQKQMISKTFGQYIPAELVEEMSKTGQQVQVGGESREMTVLFSDVRGFTTISEGLSPNDLTKLMNAFLSPMTKVIQSQRGTIDKYMGDAIMAFWGAPLTDPDHAKHAVQAGLLMVKTMHELKDDFIARGWKPIKVGIGLNTGIMNVGNMGSDFRLAYTVLGDAVNLGSRIESLTKQYGVDVMISEFTKAAVPSVICREIDLVRVKGKDEPVGLFEPLGFEGDVDAQTLDRVARHAAAIALYRKQDWAGAKAQFEALHAEEPERVVYKMYLDRIVAFEADPPGQDWDGVYTHKEKS